MEEQLCFKVFEIMFILWQVCLKYNRREGCTVTGCTMLHKCNKKVGFGLICAEAHRGYEHV